MKTKSPFDTVLFQIISIALSIGLFVFFITYFKALLKPFVMAFIVWYLIKALYTYTGKIKIMGRYLPKWFRKTLPIIIIFICVELTLELIISNLSGMIENYYTYEKTFEIFLLNLGKYLGIENLTDRLQEQVNYMDLPAFLSGTLSSLSATIGTILIIIVYIIFLLLEEATFSKKIDIIFETPHQRARVQKIINAIYESTNKYITLKTYVSLLVATLSYIVLLLFKIEYAFLWSFLIFLFNYIPYLGSFVATLLPSLFAMLQFGSVWPCVWVFISIEALQIVVGNYIEPRLMGKSLNLSPLVVVIALSFWGAVWGLLGMFLSVPITSIMVIILTQFPSTRNVAILLTENGNIDSIIIKKEKTHGENS